MTPSSRAQGAWLAVLLFYTAGVAVPLQIRLSSSRPAGHRTEREQQTEFEAARDRSRALQRRLSVHASELTTRIGIAALTLSGPETLDDLLDCVHRACGEAGATLRSAMPVAPVETDSLVLDGLHCVVYLPGEAALAGLLASLRSARPIRGVMLRGLDVHQSEDGLELEATFSTLRTREKGAAAAALAAAWESLRREGEAPVTGWLLERKPAARRAPGKTPPPAQTTETTAPAPVVAPPAPPPQPFRGRLLGVSTAQDGTDLAVFELAGQERVLAAGEKLEGWSLARTEGDHVVLEQPGRRETLYFVMADRSAPPAPRPLAVAPGKQALGLRAELLGLRAGSLPGPYQSLRHVFSVSQVLAGSVAEQAGLRAGDRILAIDGAPLRIAEQLAGLRARLAEGRAGRLSVERNGMLLELALSPLVAPPGGR